MFYLHFAEKQKKSVETTKTLLQIFLLLSSTDHSFCLVVLGNNDDNKSSPKVLFFCMRQLWYFVEKYQTFVDYCDYCNF